MCDHILRHTVPTPITTFGPDPDADPGSNKMIPVITTPESVPIYCRADSKYWVQRGNAGTLVCGLHLGPAIKRFTDPETVWLDVYGVDDSSPVTVRVKHGLFHYPYPSTLTGIKNPPQNPIQFPNQ